MSEILRLWGKKISESLTAFDVIKVLSCLLIGVSLDFLGKCLHYETGLCSCLQFGWLLLIRWWPGVVCCSESVGAGGRAGPVPPLLRPDSQSPAAGQ